MIRSQSDKKDLSRRKPPVSDLTRSRMNSSGMASTSHPSSKPNSGTEKESKRVLLSDNGRSKSDRTRGSEKQEAIARHMALAARSPASSIAANYQASSKEGIDNEGWKSKNVAGESDHMTESDLQASNKEDKQLRVSFTDSNSVREAAFRDWAIKKQALATSKQTKPQPSKQNGNGLKESEDLDATFSRDDARQVTVVKENAWSDSSTMREAIYSQWLNEKESRLKQKQAEKVGKEKQEKEELERAMKEKKTESRKAFESWREKKTEELKKKLKDQKVQGKEKEEENKEKEVTRLHESKVLFGTWKEKKDDVLKDRHLEVLRQKTEERKSSEEQVKKKRGENKKSYDQWRAVKEEKLSESHKKVQQEKRQAEAESRKSIEERKEKSVSAFESWKTRKETTELQSRSRPSSPDVRIAWSPAGVGKGGLLRSQTLRLYPRSQSPKSPSRTRKRKTIQVCCQTLEYWCVCDNGD